MKDLIFVKPRKKEFIIYKPDNSRLKAEGETVEADVYWHRREKDKEVEITPHSTKKGKK